MEPLGHAFPRLGLFKLRAQSVYFVRQDDGIPVAGDDLGYTLKIKLALLRYLHGLCQRPVFNGGVSVHNFFFLKYLKNKAMRASVLLGS